MSLAFNWETFLKNMYHCRWVHLECDKPADQELDSQPREDYICTYCKHLAAEMGALQPGAGVELAGVPAGTLRPPASNLLLQC